MDEHNEKCPRCQAQGEYLGDQRGWQYPSRRPYHYAMYQCPACDSSYGGVKVFDSDEADDTWDQPNGKD